jgi:hypothetical protein
MDALETWLSQVAAYGTAIEALSWSIAVNRKIKNLGRHVMAEVVVLELERVCKRVVDGSLGVESCAW